MENFWKKAVPVLCLIACLGCALCLWRISVLFRTVQNAHASLSQQIEEVSNRVEGIAQSIQSAAEEASRLTSFTDGTLGMINWQNKTVPFTYRLTLKNYDPSATTVDLVINGTAYSMTSTDAGEFVLQADFPLEQDIQVEKVLVRTNDTVQTQLLQNFFSPIYEAAPYFSIDAPAQTTNNRDHVFYEASGLVKMQPLHSDFSVVRADLILFLNDTEYKRIPVDLTQEGQRSYYETMQKQTTGNEALAVPEGVDPAFGFICYINEKIPLNPGDSFQFAVDIQADDGLTYRFIGNGADYVLEDEVTFHSPASPASVSAVFNADGETLFQRQDETAVK